MSKKKGFTSHNRIYWNQLGFVSRLSADRSSRCKNEEYNYQLLTVPVDVANYNTVPMHVLHWILCRNCLLLWPLKNHYYIMWSFRSSYVFFTVQNVRKSAAVYGSINVGSQANSSECNNVIMDLIPLWNTCTTHEYLKGICQ